MKYFLFFFLLAVSLVCNAQTENGLVAYYPLNGNGIDSLGMHNGTKVGILIPSQDRNGGQGCAVQFEGAKARIVIADIAPDNVNEPFFTAQRSGKQTFAYSFWFIGSGFNQGTFLRYLLNDKEEVTFGYKKDTVFFSHPSGRIWKTFEDKGWNHVVFSWYLSGQAGTTITVNGETKPFSEFMNHFVPDITNIKGVLGSDGLFLDDFRIYNRTLSSSEIAQLYAATNSCDIATGTESEELIKEGEKSILKIVNMSGQEIKDFQNFRGLALVLYTDGTHKKVLK